MGMNSLHISKIRMNLSLQSLPVSFLIDVSYFENTREVVKKYNSNI